MGHLIASSIARARGDNSTALRHADNAFAINPDSEEVLLHLSAVLGDQRELNRLATQIRPAVESRRYSARLDWNYSQTLHQLGLRDEAAGVLRRALSEKTHPMNSSRWQSQRSKHGGECSPVAGYRSNSIKDQTSRVLFSSPSKMETEES
jgi:Tfp pilus assembly protein PilF